MCLILIIVSVFLYNFVPPIQLQWRFVILAIVSLLLAHYLPPNDRSAYGYAFVIAGVVSYKGILMDELRLISKLTQKYNSVESKDINTKKE